MGISIFDKIIEALHLTAIFKTGDKQITVQNAGQNIYNVVVNPKYDQDSALIAKRSQKLIESKNKNIIDTNLDLVLGTFLGIVKSPEKPGTRLHLEFAVINKADIPTVVQSVYIKLNEGLVHFKLFFKSNSNASRAPDFSQNFPIIINSKGATKFQIEFENISQALVNKGNNNGEVIVVADNNKMARRKFSLNVDDAMIETLKQSQMSADTTRISSIYPATIQS